MSGPELLPCPFCGREARIVDGDEEVRGGLWEIGCWDNWQSAGTCNAAPAATGKTRDEAVAAWNRRAIYGGEVQ